MSARRSTLFRTDDSKSISGTRRDIFMWFLAAVPTILCSCQLVNSPSVRILPGGGGSTNLAYSIDSSPLTKAAGGTTVFEPRSSLSTTSMVREHSFDNWAHGFRAEVTRDGYVLSVNREKLYRTQFKTQGRGSLGQADSQSLAVQSNETRAEIIRDGMVEWYINGPSGWEQGWTLQKPCEENGVETIRVEVSGDLHVVVDKVGRDSNATSGLLLNGEGQIKGKYTKLLARDALGVSLPVGLVQHDKGFDVRVDVRGATYPIEVDPLFVPQDAKLVPDDPAYAGEFGASVAVDEVSNTVVVGVPSFQRANGSGSAFVYVNGVLQAEIVPSDVGINRFGQSVAVSGDTILVGTASNFHSTYVYVRNGTSWAYQAKLAGGGGSGNPYQFTAVEGDTALVGDEVMNSAYVFTRSGASWTLQGTLTPADASANYFGRSVSLSGNLAVVGALGTNNGGNTNQGAAFVYSRNGATWSKQAKIQSSDGAGGDNFGTSVAISGTTILAGAPKKSFGVNCQKAGAIYAFVQSGVTWSEQMKDSGDCAGGQLGMSVSFNGTTAAVGEPGPIGGAPASAGAVVFYKRTGTSWPAGPTPTLVGDAAASDGLGAAVAMSGASVVAAVDAGLPQPHRLAVYQFTEISPGNWNQTREINARGDQVGQSVAISGDTILVGAPNALFNNSPLPQGAAYVFKRTGAAWASIPQAKLTASDASASDRFGSAVSAQGDTAVVGAEFARIGANFHQGAAYVFTRNGTSWAQGDKLTATDGAVTDQFGAAVSLDGTRVIVGAPGATVGGNNAQGVAYIFASNGSSWVQEAKLSASDGAFGTNFGCTVSLDANTAIVGTCSGGAAYVYSWNGAEWVQVKLTDPSVNNFGTSVAVHGDTVLVGAASNSTVDVFVRSNGTWTKQGQLLGASGAVALQGDVAAVGSSFFVRSESSWSMKVSATASDGVALGPSVALDGRDVVVGAPNAAYGGPYNYGQVLSEGAAYVFHLTGIEGDSCVDSSGCSSNYACVDGLCCNRPCAGSCEVCSLEMGAIADGVCTILGQGSPGIPACGVGLQCDGVSGECSDKKSNGTVCSNGTECASSFCVEGVCCDQSCSGKCEACLKDTKETGEDGFCGPALAGSNPNNHCQEHGANDPCGELGECAADGTCAVEPQSVSCGTPSCSDNSLYGSFCNGLGECLETSTPVPCTPYQCVVDACASPCVTDDDCVDGYRCLANGLCTAKKTLGEGCASSSECDSSFCVDDVCCDSPCNGQCEFCALSDSLGECSVLGSGQPRGERMACAGTGVCAGECKGDSSQCAYPAQGTTCLDGELCAGDAAYAGLQCDGAGACIGKTPTSCAPFTCDPDNGKCKTACVTTADCSEGATCSSSGLCTLGAASCSNKTTISQADGSLIDCSPFICQAGQCTATCSVNSDCASSASCANGQCVDNGGEGGQSGSGGASGASNSAAPKDDGGCGCRVVQNDSAYWRVWCALALGLGMVARRRVNRRVQLR